jgi:hypothetical protein
MCHHQSLDCSDGDDLNDYGVIIWRFTRPAQYYLTLTNTTSEMVSDCVCSYERIHHFSGGLG